MADPDFAAVFNELARIARTADSVQTGWRDMCAVADAAIGTDLTASVANLDLESDITQVRRSLEKVIDDHPPPKTVDTLLFGLFDEATSDGGGVRAGYYVAGIGGFRPDDGDSICDPDWWPDGRYFGSDVLDSILAIATRSDEPEKQTMLDYALRFGAAALISRFAAQKLPYRIVVAFDEGDFAEIAPIRRSHTR
jgi:hypothetical protein